MMILRNLMAVILVLILPLSLLSQLNASLKYGINSSSVSTKGAFDNFDNLKGASIGQYVEGMIHYHFDEHWSVGLGMAYKEKGFTLKQENNITILGLNIPVGLKAEVGVKSIDIPITAKYYIPNPYINTYILAGGGMSFHTGSSLSTSAALIGDIALTQSNINNLVNSNEFFGSIGLGFYKSAGKGKLFSEIRYDHSFQNYTSDLFIDIPIRNRGITVGVGYSMPLN